MNMLFSLFYHGIQKSDSKTDELSETTAILDRVEHLFIRILSSELNTREPEKTWLTWEGKSSILSINIPIIPIA